MVSHRTLQADMAPVVAGRIRRALEVVPADKLILSSDCGFGRQGFNRTVAFYKATGIAQGRNIVLKELGVEERYVPAADPALQVDVRPDHEPLTHLPSPFTKGR
jgi:5-methyltetrahydropteroyltriglutamate--homocysteine methyltransferase